MKYFLDFDGVLFNTKPLKEELARWGLLEEKRSASTFDIIATHNPDFDLKSLVFKDARTFLEEHASDCVVVSSYISAVSNGTENTDVLRAYQEKKIELSGVTKLVGRDRVHVVGVSKQQALLLLKEECDKNNEHCVFVDDRREHIEEALKLGIEAVWMQRHRSVPQQQGQIVTIASFDELAGRLQ